MLLRLNVDGHATLKVMAAKERRTLSSLAVKALNDLLKIGARKPRLLIGRSNGPLVYFSERRDND